MAKKELKTWGQLVAEDPRYQEVQNLVAQNRLGEAQALENGIMREVIALTERVDRVVDKSLTDHLVGPETEVTKGYNVYCPVKQEFTYIGPATSADGMEVDVCKACNTPEPVLLDVTDKVLDDIHDRLEQDK